MAQKAQALPETQAAESQLINNSVPNGRSQGKEEALPLPKWLVRVYYIFPIVLYIPDMIFNFYVYSDGSGINLNQFDITQVPLVVLWGFLSIGIVGMAWLLSVLAPWHWVRGNRFQSIMCWFGVIIATTITTWNSLAFRSENFKMFATDKWITQTFHINIAGFSPTMILVAVAPPFWGLFWAIVQPAERRKSAEEERLSYAAKIERMKQEAELKRIRAESNTLVRQAQLKGFVSTVKSAQRQISGQPEETNAGQVTVTQDEENANSDRVLQLPTGAAKVRRIGQPGSSFDNGDSGEYESVQSSGSIMSYSAASQQRSAVYSAPQNGSPSQSSFSSDSFSSSSDGLPAIRAGSPRASTLLRNFADGEHIMRTVDTDIERMKARGMKVTYKSFAEYRGIELPLSKQLLTKWKEWKATAGAVQETPSAPIESIAAENTTENSMMDSAELPQVVTVGE